MTSLFSSSYRALRIRRVAEMLDVNPDTVRQLIQTAQLRAFNVTVRQNPARPEYRVLERDLWEFIERRSQPRMPEEPAPAILRRSKKMNHLP